jgi:hypothetical protein
MLSVLAIISKAVFEKLAAEGAARRKAQARGGVLAK